MTSKFIENFPEQPNEADKRHLAAFVRLKKQSGIVIPEEKDRYVTEADEARELLYYHNGSTDIG